MNVSAVLLAGGESRRMGHDKATLLFRGKPLWQIQLQLLRELAPREILISARSDPTWRPADVKFVTDAAPSRGPLSGIAASLLRIATPYLLALAIDMPFMTVEYLRSLCGRIRAACGVVPVIHGRAEPLAAIYPLNADVDLVRALNGNDFSLQTVARSLIATSKLIEAPVPPEDEHLFRNLNEPGDL
ncbi:MAG TPA: molybdenum cofactor guanylyltransferase [Candidatus Udaeobacter sp.]|nr:molybdenum cofactor guanylyltransferase [Candidatus Udaeobacter sp.]